MQPIERRLAAILAADMVGYSRLMAEDEVATLARLKAYMDTVAAAIAHHRGRIVATAGDGVLAEFQSAVQAVAAAVALQESLARDSADTPPDRQVRCRIGINVGDVMVENGNIFGDGVNIAARLEALAEPGGILITRAARDQVQGKLPLRFASLGSQTVKNIPQAVEVYRVEGLYAVGTASPPPKFLARRRLLAVGALGGAGTAAALIGWLYWPLPIASPPIARQPVAQAQQPATEGRKTITVLPFVNMSGDRSQDYFAGGLTEDLMTDLTKVSGLSVLARLGSALSNSASLSPAELGRSLGVSYVVEGSVRRAGERVRIAAQLIDAGSGQQLWSERYDREIKDIFDLQDEVRQHIVAALSLQLTPTEKADFGRRQTADPIAYDLWARGREQFNTFTRDGILEARRLFAAAVERDPGFARALAQLANTHIGEIDLQFSPVRSEITRLAVDLARRAVALDPSDPQLRWVLARTLPWDGSHDEAIVEMQTALRRDPDFANGHAYMTQILTLAGRAEEALAHVERAMRIESNYPFWYTGVRGNAQFMLGRYEEAAASYRQSLERNPNSIFARRGLASTLGHLGRRAEAEWELAELEAQIGKPLDLAEVDRFLAYKDPAYRNRLIEGLRKAGGS